MASQRYVSPDLTHFVGRSRRSQRERYLLLRRILRGGVLKSFPRMGAGGTASRLERNDTKRLSSNHAYGLSIVCFCDIPAGDLALHVRNYSQFGIAFTKDFLAERGATPVIYVPKSGRPSLLPYKGFGRKSVASQAAAFDHFGDIFRRLERGLAALEDMPERQRTVQDRRRAKELSRAIDFMLINFMSNLKFFDHRLHDDDPRNFYMGREWRISANVPFSLPDVQRIILPGPYAHRFRRDFPMFDGELMFADT